MKTIKEISDIYSFIKVSEFRSFTRAAQEIGVSKASLSKAITRLESSLGQKLLNRSTRLVDFTVFGKQYYDFCHHKINEMESITKQSKEFFNIPKDNLKISLAGAYGEEVISPIITKILKRNPNIHAQLIFSTEFVDINKDDFDLAIRVGLKKPRKGHVLKLSARKEIICASSDFISQYGMPKSHKDLSDFNCLIGSQENWLFNINDKVEKIKVHGNFKSSNGRALANACLNGLGITKLPEVYVKEHIENRKLIPILEEVTTESIPIWAIMPSKKNMPESIRLFLNEFN